MFLLFDQTCLNKGPLPICTIAIYMNMGNVHRMSIKIEHRNLEIRKIRNDFSVQVRNFLLPLSLKVLRHKERDTHSFYSGFFISPPPHLVRHLRKASVSKRKSTLLVRCLVSTQLTFFKIPKILRALPVSDVIRTC